MTAITVVKGDLTQQKVDDIFKDTERDNFMDAQTAKKYGLIDDVLVRKPEASAAE